MDSRMDEFTALIAKASAARGDGNADVEMGPQVATLPTSREHELARVVTARWSSFIQMYDTFTDSGPHGYANDEAFQCVWESAERVLHAARAYASYVPHVRDSATYGPFVGPLFTACIRPLLGGGDGDRSDCALMHYERIAASTAAIMHQMKADQAAYLAGQLPLQRHDGSRRSSSVVSPVPLRPGSATFLEHRLDELETIHALTLEVAEHTAVIGTLVNSQNTAVTRLEHNITDAAVRVDMSRDSILHHYYHGGFGSTATVTAALCQCRALVIVIFLCFATLVLVSGGDNSSSHV